MTAARKRTLICLAAFVIALILACGFLFSSAQVAEALLPESWNNEADKRTGDWYLDGDNLDIDGVKSTVDSWRISSAYDFSALADDPVVIAVIDSGVNPSHDIFGGGGSCPDVFFRDSSGAIVGANTAGGASFVDDASDRHGTHVAGIIAVLIHALDLEDYIKIMPIKAGTPEGTKTSFSLTDVREAITFALSNGADIVFHAAGATGLGVIEACQEAGVYAIGVDSDQSSIAPETVITSAMKRVDNAVYDSVESLINGTLEGGVVTYDLSMGGVDIAPTQDLLPEDVISAVEDVKQQIIDGEIVVPNDQASFEAAHGDVYELD